MIAAALVTLALAQGLGDPVPTLSPEQLARWQDGLEQFKEEDSVEQGLGPVFNDVSCVACHDAGAVGGASASGKRVQRYGKFRMVNGFPTFNPMANRGGSLVHSKSVGTTTSPFGFTTTWHAETIPKGANVRTFRATPALFGLGLVERIPDGEILANAVNQPPSIRGRVALLFSSDGINPPVWINDHKTDDEHPETNYYGRLGWKGQHGTSLDFARDAYLHENGKTTPLDPHEHVPGGGLADKLFPTLSGVMVPFAALNPSATQPDDLTTDEVDSLATFMKFLAPPPQTVYPVAGKLLFIQVGCAGCHRIEYTTPDGPGPLDGITIEPHSDFLLHDMGSSADGIAQGPAGMNEMLTRALWGLRFRKQFWHDGNSPTVRKAINRHAGQGQAAKDAFNALTPDQQTLLVRYIKGI